MWKLLETQSVLFVFDLVCVCVLMMGQSVGGALERVF